MDNQNLEPITWQELKDFVNSLSEDQLVRPAHILFQDETSARPLLEPFVSLQDVYRNTEDSEDCATLKELEEAHGADFNKQLYRIATPKGTPFLWAE